jgi:hypothetical protein
VNNIGDEQLKSIKTALERNKNSKLGSLNRKGTLLAQSVPHDNVTLQVNGNSRIASNISVSPMASSKCQFP